LLWNFMPSWIGALLKLLVEIVEGESHTEQGQVLADVSESDAVFETPFNVAVTVTVCRVLIVAAVAWNAAWEAEAKTVTEAGTVSELLLSEIATGRLAAVAELSVTVHVPLAPEVSVVGAHTSDVRVTGGVRLMEAVFMLPLNVVVTVAVCAMATVTAVALNVPVVLPAATVTETGTVRFAVLLDTETRLPPAGAAALRVTAQVAAAPDGTEVGLHVSPLMLTTDGVTLTEVILDVPLAAAVTVISVVAETVPAVAVKTAVALPAATVTESGTVR
jgi:hypothetical protein